MRMSVEASLRHSGDPDAALIRAAYVVEAANIPTTDAAQALLHERGVLVVPDFVANGGTNSWFWWVLLGLVDPAPEPSFKRIAETMRQTVRNLLVASEQQRILPRQAAEAMALANLDDLERQYSKQKV